MLKVVLRSGTIYVSLIIAISFVFAEGNASLEQRIDHLEENLSITQRQMDIALKRTITLISRIEELEGTIAMLKANLSKVAGFATPSAPKSFHVERIRKSGDGNYSVLLRWMNNPGYEAVTQYVVWYARPGEDYKPGSVINQTGKRIHKAKIGGFKGGEDIIFKIFAKNEAGQGKPGYREVRIRPYAPFLMSRLKIAGGIIAILAFASGVIWLAWRWRRRAKQKKGKNADKGSEEKP